MNSGQVSEGTVLQELFQIVNTSPPCKQKQSSFASPDVIRNLQLMECAIANCPLILNSSSDCPNLPEQPFSLTTSKTSENNSTVQKPKKSSRFQNRGSHNGYAVGVWGTEGPPCRYGLRRKRDSFRLAANISAPLSRERIGSSRSSRISFAILCRTMIQVFNCPRCHSYHLRKR